MLVSTDSIVTDQSRGSKKKRNEQQKENDSSATARAAVVGSLEEDIDRYVPLKNKKALVLSG